MLEGIWNHLEKRSSNSVVPKVLEWVMLIQEILQMILVSN